MRREEELLKIFEDVDKDILVVISPMIEDLVHIETQLDSLKHYPFLKVHPNNPSIQKITPAGRLYKDLLASEKDIVRILCGLIKKADDNETESPLRTYLKSLELR